MELVLVKKHKIIPLADKMGFARKYSVLHTLQSETDRV